MCTHDILHVYTCLFFACWHMLTMHVYTWYFSCVHMMIFCMCTHDFQHVYTCVPDTCCWHMVLADTWQTCMCPHAIFMCTHAPSACVRNTMCQQPFPLWWYVKTLDTYCTIYIILFMCEHELILCLYMH